MNRMGARGLEYVWLRWRRQSNFGLLKIWRITLTSFSVRTVLYLVSCIKIVLSLFKRKVAVKYQHHAMRPPRGTIIDGGTLHDAQGVSLGPKLFDLGLEDPEWERAAYDKERKVSCRGGRGGGARLRLLSMMAVSWGGGREEAGMR
jgi:hypothetical protein